MLDPQESDNIPDDIKFHDISPAIEFVCWVVVCISPLLRWVNGAAVTTDQFYIQLTLFSVALIGSIVLRMVHVMRGN